MNVQFETTAIAANNRNAYWHDVVCETYVPVECEPLGENIDATLSIRSFGAGELSEIYSSPMNYSRTENDIRINPSDWIQLCLLLEGKGQIEQCGKQATIIAGDFALYDAAEPFSLTFPENYRSIIFKLPRTSLKSLATNTSKLMATRISSTSLTGSLVSPILRETAGVGKSLSEAHASRIYSSLTDILCVALESEISPRVSINSKQQAAMQRIKSFMLGRLSDPELNIEMIANECYVSGRTIHRLFVAEGTTAIRWLWQQRLLASHDLLVSGKSRSVSEAALDCGFSDFSHFTRSFKREYGVTPHSFLRQ